MNHLCTVEPQPMNRNPSTQHLSTREPLRPSVRPSVRPFVQRFRRFGLEPAGRGCAYRPSDIPAAVVTVGAAGSSGGTTTTALPVDPFTATFAIVALLSNCTAWTRTPWLACDPLV